MPKRRSDEEDDDERMADLMPQIVEFFLDHIQPTLDEYAVTHCSGFLDLSDSAVYTADINKEDNLERWAIFQEYTKLFESKIEQLLAANAVTLEMFVKKCKEGEDLAATLGQRGEHTSFMDLLRVIDDFESFLVFMRSEAQKAAKKHAVEDKESLEKAITAHVETLVATALQKAVELEESARGEDDEKLMSNAVTYFLHVVQPKLMGFVKKHAEAFRAQDESTDWGDQLEDDEFSIHHHALYKEYTALFEDAMEAFLRDRSLSVVQFVDKCRAVEESKGKRTGKTPATSFVDVVGAMDKFEEWLAFMRMGSQWVSDAKGWDDQDDSEQIDVAFAV